MNTRISIEELLRWRQAQAESDAPPAPRAAHLLEMSRPWWEVCPDQVRACVEQLWRIQIAYGHAMAEPGQGRAGHPVPALIASADERTESFVRVLYLSVREDRLRLRFQIEAAPREEWRSFEVTFICSASQRPVTCARTTASVDGEFRVEAELPLDIAREWERLKVTDRMPFRLILRADTNSG